MNGVCECIMQRDEKPSKVLSSVPLARCHPLPQIPVFSPSNLFLHAPGTDHWDSPPQKPDFPSHSETCICNQHFTVCAAFTSSMGQLLGEQVPAPPASQGTSRAKSQASPIPLCSPGGPGTGTRRGGTAHPAPRPWGCARAGGLQAVDVHSACLSGVAVGRSRVLFRNAVSGECQNRLVSG